MEPISSQGSSSDQWEDVLRAAPDATFYEELKSFLRSVDLGRELVYILNDTYIDPWERAGVASVQLGALWINLGMASIDLPAATPEAADFALGCSDLARKFTTSLPDLEMFRLFIRSKALLILASCEERTSPNICRDLATEQAMLLAIVREQAGEGLGKYVRRMLSPVLALTLDSLRLLVETRCALVALRHEVTRLAETALELSDHASKKDPSFVEAVWTTISVNLHEGSHPNLEIRRYAAYGRYQLCECALIGLLASDAPRGLCQHASLALAHLDCMARQGAAFAAGFNRRDSLLKAQILNCHGRYAAAVKEIDLMPAPLEATEIEVRSSIQGWEWYKKGDLKKAQEAYLQGCPSAEEVVSTYLAKWLGDEVSPDTVADLTTGDPLELSQTTWRMLARISATMDSKKDAIRWISQTGGFLVDSLTEHRGEWAARFRRKDFSLRMLKMGWSGSDAATVAHKCVSDRTTQTWAPNRAERGRTAAGKSAQASRA